MTFSSQSNAMCIKVDPTPRVWKT